jgi:hypothetical protein
MQGADSLQELRRNMIEIRNFQSNPKASKSLKSLILDTKTNLEKAKGEFLGEMVKSPGSYPSGGMSILSMLDNAIRTCNACALIADQPNIDLKTLATSLYVTGNFQEIESYLNALAR